MDRLRHLFRRAAPWTGILAVGLLLAVGWTDGARDTTRRSPPSASPDAGPAPPPPNSRTPPSREGRPDCPVEQFDVYYLAEGIEVVKTIDCATRTLERTSVEPVDDGRLARGLRAGLPRDTWFVLVDPEHGRSEFLAPSELLRLSELFELTFYGRDRERNLLVYEYASPL